MLAQVTIRSVSAGKRDLVRMFLQELADHQRAVSASYAARYTERTVDDWAEACCRELATGRSWAAIAEDSGSPVGFIKASVKGSTGTIDDLVVLPQAQGKGIGTSLLAWAQHEFDTRGIKELELTVSEGNDSALAFYERHGFQTVTRTLRAGRIG